MRRRCWPACRGSRRTRLCSWSRAWCRTARVTPLVYEWVGVTFRSERFASLTTFDDVIERTGLGGGAQIANRGVPVGVDALARLLPAAVKEARRHIVEHRTQFEDVINAKLDEELKALEQLRARRFAQLELKLEQSAQPAAHTAHREERARRDIEEILDDYLEWIQETVTTERTPWLKVICAMVGNATDAVANSATLTSSGGAASDNA